MRKLITICLLFLVSTSWSIAGTISAYALQDTTIRQDTVRQDSIGNNKTKEERDDSYLRNLRKGADDAPFGDNEHLSKKDSSEISPVVVIQDSMMTLKPRFVPVPKKAVLYALIPGAGQIYNRQYWKLPIVYGGVIGFTYAISWNGRMYNDYTRAHRDIVTGKGDSWKHFISNPEAISEEELRTRYEPLFKRQKDNFRRNRDLAIILSVGFYALTILDAYVDAHLYEFDVSPDLSMRLEPVMYDPSPTNNRGFGLQCSFTF